MPNKQRRTAARKPRPFRVPKSKVSLGQWHDICVYLRLRVQADGPGDDVAVGVNPGLFLGDDALVHRVFHPTVVLAYLVQLPIP